MSDSSENQIIQQGEDDVLEIDNTNYFKEQDEKFEELHKKLQKLKEENKKQIDAIINSLDDLMASKCVIEQTLDKVGPDDVPIDIANEKLNIVDLLSKVTGIVNDPNDNSSRISEDKDCKNKDDSALPVRKEEHESQPSDPMDCTDSMIEDSELSKKKEDNPLINLGDGALLQVSQEEQLSQTSDKIDCTDKKTTEDSPLVASED